jgi:hypothetical protein
MVACKGAHVFTLFEQDPYAIKAIINNAQEELLLVSYLSSDRIDLIKIDKNSQNGAQLVKSFHAHEWISGQTASKSLKDQRIITRKIETGFKDDLRNAKVYFLLEQHPKKISTLEQAEASYIVVIKISDLIGAPSAIVPVDFLNLAEPFSIVGAQDFYLDDARDEAIVLGRVPEMLYKIDLSRKSLIGTSSRMCKGATSMAVSMDKDFIVIPCIKDNRVATFSLSSLSPQYTSEIVGRGPSYVVIDERNNLIYCSYNNDGIVAIFDYTLDFLGHIFKRAPSNRKGS